MDLSLPLITASWVIGSAALALGLYHDHTRRRMREHEDLAFEAGFEWATDLLSLGISLSDLTRRPHHSTAFNRGVQAAIEAHEKGIRTW